MQPLSTAEILSSFIYGVYFDLPVLAICFAPVWIWLLGFPHRAKLRPRLGKWLFLLPVSVCLLANAIDTAYSRITTRRSGYELFSLLGDEGNHMAPFLRDYALPILALVGSLLLIYWLVPTGGDSLYLYKGKKWKVALRIVFAAGIWLVMARGGLRLKPLQPVDAGEFGNSRLIPLIASTPLQMISTWGQHNLPTYEFMADDEARKLVFGAAPQPIGKLSGMNVVVIVVESLGRDYTGFMNNVPFTPFLDSLSKRSMVFPYCYANGVRSIEMVPSIFCGIPSLMDEHYITSAYSANQVQNIFGWFGAKGYTTSFFHGATNGTMRFQPFLLSTGLSKYCGLNEYPNREDYDGSWGIYDEPYLQHVGHYLDTVRKPFFTGVFTLTSHHPYKLPEQYEQHFPKGTLPIHHTIGYTDMAIRKFFEYAQKQAWFSNTIFIITGDHTSHSKEAYFYSQTGHYEIPLLIYSPKLSPGVVNKSVSQCDIMPTLIGIMGYDNNWSSFGRSAFDSTYPGFSLHRENGINYILQYPYTLGMADDGRITDFYTRYRNSRRVTHLARNGKQFELMQKYLKASLQLYSRRLKKEQKK